MDVISSSNSADCYVSQTLCRPDANGILVISEKALGVERTSRAFSALRSLFDARNTVSRFQPFAHAGYLILAGEENEDAAGRQSRVNFGGLADGFAQIVRYGAAIKVNSHWILAGWNFDDGRRGRE